MFSVSINHSEVTGGIDPPFRQPPVIMLCLQKRILQSPLDPDVDPVETSNNMPFGRDRVYFLVVFTVIIIITLVIGALLEAMPVAGGHSRCSPAGYIGAYGGSPSPTCAGNNTVLQGTQASSTLQNASEGALGGLYPLNNPPGDGDSDDEDTNNPGDGFALNQHEKSAEVPLPKRVHCLYYLRDPQKHRSCWDSKFKDWKDLREHLLNRKHRRPIICQNCGFDFQGDLKKAHGAWLKHTQEKKCKPGPSERPSGLRITAEQEKEIKKLGQKGKHTDHLLDKWRKTWKILFRGYQCPVSPYIINNPIVHNHGKSVSPSSLLSTDASLRFEREVFNMPAMANVPEQDRVNLGNDVIRTYLAGLQQQQGQQGQQGQQQVQVQMQTAAESSAANIPLVDASAPTTLSLHQSELYHDGHPSSSASAILSTQPTDLSSIQVSVPPAMLAPIPLNFPVPMELGQPGALSDPQWPSPEIQNDPALFPDADFTDPNWWMSFELPFGDNGAPAA